MQTDIHPDYPFIKVVLADGTEYTTRSTTGKEYRSEVDSSNHPFYTGKKTMVDTAGRVEKFMRRYGKDQAKTVPQDEAPAADAETAAEQEAEAQEAVKQASAARAIDPGTPAPETKTADGPDDGTPVPGTAKPPASSPDNPARDTEDD